MINQVYRLVGVRQIQADFVDLKLNWESVIVRPTYLSICAADQRYYTGSRGSVILKEKLPMALIHEAVGEVVYDPKGEYRIGTTVVMIPNTPSQYDEIIKDNYLSNSKFRASGFDGFMQNVVKMRRNLIIPFHSNPRTAVLLELMSVAVNAIETFKKQAHARRNVIGVWGNGNVGFVTALLLKKEFPDSRLVVFGVTEEKMAYFSFADETYLINSIPDSLRVDHAFECVGGVASETAIAQMIDYIRPQGSISLMGVSEQPVAINTRMVLEKGLNMIGNSRSSYSDFERAVKLLDGHPDVREYISTIISEEIEVKTIQDIHKAFENDWNNTFKTIMKWEI